MSSSAEPSALLAGQGGADPEALDGAGNPRSKQQVQQSGRSKKRGRAATSQEEVNLTAEQAEFTKLVRVDPRKDASNEDPSRVQLSKVGRALPLQLSEDRLSVTGYKGFRTVRGSHAVRLGTWYCEVHVKHLGKTGHIRLGWCTRQAELQAPAGFDEHGFSYRDLEGSKVHKGLREAYGETYGEGDIVGLLIHLPESGRGLEEPGRKVLRYKGSYYYKEEQEDAKPLPIEGSLLVFSKNGVSQGVAYSNIADGNYCPAISLFTLPEQSEGATATINFGPVFKYPPPMIEGVPLPRPLSDLAVAVTPLPEALPAPQAPLLLALPAPTSAADPVALQAALVRQGQEAGKPSAVVTNNGAPALML